MCIRWHLVLAALVSGCVVGGEPLRREGILYRDGGDGDSGSGGGVRRPVDAGVPLDALAAHYSHVPTDRGPAERERPAPAMSCFDALRSAVGAPCGFSGRCATSDLCCAAAVTCEGGVVVELNHPPECDGGVRPTLCVRGRSSVSGNTPLGPVDFDSSYASFSSAQDVVLIMTTSSIRNSFAVCGGDRLSFWLFPTEGATGVPAGIDRAGEALAQLVVGDVIVHTRAVFESVDEAAVSAFGPLAKPSLSGSFRLDEPGWDVSGAFTVYGCEDLKRP